MASCAAFDAKYGDDGRMVDHSAWASSTRATGPYTSSLDTSSTLQCGSRFRFVRASSRVFSATWTLLVTNGTGSLIALSTCDWDATARMWSTWPILAAACGENGTD